MDDVLIHYGGAVKALGDGRIKAPLITFGSADDPDLVRDFFTKDSDLWESFPAERPLLYAHGLDPKVGKRRLGVTGKAALSLKEEADEDGAAGVWLEAQLNVADAYERAIYEMAEKKKLGTSSGSASHLVDREPVGKSFFVKSWPIAEASLTPAPCEPKNFGRVLPIKALPTLFDPYPASEDMMPASSSGEGRLAGEMTMAACRELHSSMLSLLYDLLLYRTDAPVDERIDALRTSCAQYTETLVSTVSAILAGSAGETAPAAAGYLMSLLPPSSLPLAGKTLGDAWSDALAVIAAAERRSRAVHDLRIKEGRTISAATRSRIAEALALLEKLLADTEIVKPEGDVDPPAEAKAEGDAVTAALVRYEAARAKANALLAPIFYP